MRSKIQSCFAVLVLLLSVMLPIQSSQAQTMVKFNLDLAIQLANGDPIPQKQYRFDIIERDANMQPIDGAKVYKYDASNPNTSAPLYLPEGNYTFRLYDGAAHPFVRDGQALGPKYVQVSDPTTPKTLVDQNNIGQLNDWGNGTVVYDVNFQVVDGPGLVNATTGESEMTLKILLASTSETALSNPGEGNETTAETNDDTAGDSPTTSEATGAITVPVTVTDDQGLGVAGVTVQANEAQLTTDGQGNVVFSLTPGPVIFKITEVPQGYEGLAEFDPITLDQELTQPIALPITKVAATAAEPTTAAFTFSAVDENDQPLANVTIQVGQDQGVTDANGLVTFNHLGLGTHNYTITTVPEGYVIDVTSGEMMVTQDNNQSKTLTFSADPATIPQTLTVTVSDENGAGVANVSVVIKDTAVKTDGNGLATFTSLTPGQYTALLTDIPEGYQADQASYNVTIYPGVENTLTMGVHSVAPATGSLRISLVDQDNKPVVGAVVTVADQAYTSDSQGIISQKTMEVGTYTYTLTSLPQGYQGQVSDNVTIEADQESQLTLQVERQVKQGSLRLSVQDQNKTPVADVKVMLDQDATAVTDRNGRIQFDNLTPGQHRLAINEVPAGYTGDTLTETITVNEGETLEKILTLTKEEANRQLTISAVDQNGQPVADVAITIANQEKRTDSQGQIHFSAMKPGTYDYQVSLLPDKYTGQTSGQVKIPEGEDATLTIHLQKEITPATATLRVIDQNGQPVAGVGLRFGGLIGKTDNQGYVVFTELEPGKYYYNFQDFPQGYQATMEDGLADLKEGQNFSVDLTVEKAPEQGNVLVTVKDQKNQPVMKAILEIKGLKLQTDSRGQVKFTKVPVGNQTLTLVQLPKDYQQSNQTYTVTVANQATSEFTVQVTKTEPTTVTPNTTKQPTTPKETTKATTKEEKRTTVAPPVIVETTLAKDQQKKLDQEVQAATQQFVDAQTGVEVWVNPQDANKVAKLVVNRIDRSQISALAQLDADVYQITLVDKHNQAITLTKVAEIKVPTRPVNAQVKVLRVDNNQLASLTFSLYNRRVTYRTQSLGQFAISYGQGTVTNVAKTTQGAKVAVTKSTSVEPHKTLPNTGESDNRALLVAGSLLFALGVGLVSGKVSPQAVINRYFTSNKKKQ